jgi:peptidoglycan hydrolase-like protein with peptidoglycan-binding domain
MTLHASKDKAIRRRSKRQTDDLTDTPSLSRIVALQPLVGNRGMQRLLNNGQIDATGQKTMQQIARAEVAVGEQVLDNATSPDAVSPFEGEHTVLKRGAKGREVFYLQRRLNLFGAKLVEDGDWGQKTQDAVIAFQNTHDLKPDGHVGPLTWTKLDSAPDNSTLAVDPAIDLTSEDARMGGFKNFVDQGVLAKDVAFLLNEMFQDPGNYTREMARFAHQELSNGKLIGFVRITESDKIKSKLAAKHHQLLADDVTAASGAGINAITRGVTDGANARSYILFKDAELDSAKTSKDRRDFVVLEISHELTHHRNRAEFDQQANKELPTSPNAKQFFVDTDRAKNFTNTQFVRATFIDELVARHVAFQVDQEVLPPDLRTIPTPLAYYKAALNFAKNFTFYNDNGYMEDLATNAPDLFRQQVANWIGEMVNRQFHSDAKENAKRQIFFQSVFLSAVTSSFAEPSVDPSGDR